ncbi:MAG: DUF3047 domain-containing protein [Thermodesulfobacteriota bacterium]
MGRHLLILLFMMINATVSQAQEAVTFDGFGNNFADWTVKEFKGRADYQVKTSPRPMITLSTEGSNFMLIRELKDFDLQKYPVLTFEWMVMKNPLNGDLRKKETDDQAAGLYVTLPFFPEMVNFNTIGYVWDPTAPPGVYPSLWRTNIKYVVLRSGPAGLGQWYREQRNIVEDFKTIWGITITQKRKVVISLAANSDGTRSSSLAAFESMGFMKK